MSKSEWVSEILPNPSVGDVGPEVEDVCEMNSPCEFNYCFLWWPWGICRLVTANLTIGKRSTLYSAEIVALQKDKFHADISGCRFKMWFFNHYSQTKNNTNRINYRGEKNSNQKKLFFFKAKEIYIWVLLIYPGKGPCLLTGLQAVFLIFCPHLNSLVRFSQLHGTSYWFRRIPSYFVIFFYRKQRVLLGEPSHELYFQLQEFDLGCFLCLWFQLSSRVCELCSWEVCFSLQTGNLVPQLRQRALQTKAAYLQSRFAHQALKLVL